MSDTVKIKGTSVRFDTSKPYLRIFEEDDAGNVWAIDYKVVAQRDGLSYAATEVHRHIYCHHSDYWPGMLPIFPDEPSLPARFMRWVRRVLKRGN